MKKGIVTLMLIVFCCIGCITTTDEETDEKQYALDPNMADQFEQGAETGITIAQALSAFWPALIPVATAAGGIFATYKKIKPKLQKAINERDIYYKGGEVLAIALEDIKTNQPDIWAEIVPKLDDLVKSSHDIENAVRGFRHLPAKQ